MTTAFRVSRLLPALCTILSAFPSPAADQPSPTSKLNVLFIVADDLRDTLGCYGHPLAKTPNIDRLAARGVRFDRAYVQYPVCNPSRSSFLSGLHPDQTGVLDNRTILRDKRPNVVTFPQLLKEHGWHTAAYGKIFHLGGNRNAGTRARFVDAGVSWHEALDYQLTDIGKRQLAGRNLTDGDLSWCRWAKADGGDDDQPDGQIASAAIAAIRAQGDKPWLVGAGFMKPHDPFVAPARYFDLHPPGSLKLHRDPADMTPAPPLAVGFGAFGRAFSRFTDRERIEFLQAYLACGSFMDTQVGRLLDELDRADLWDRTLVIFIGDHGYHLGERNWWNKNTLFERSCRTPLIVVAPGAKPGVARGIVEFVDLFPTIADYCGVTPPQGLAGRSLRPFLENPESNGKSAAFTVVSRGANGRGDSVRVDRWRYIVWSDGARELYDHDNDPEETRNIADQHADIAAELNRLLATRRPPSH